MTNQLIPVLGARRPLCVRALTLGLLVAPAGAVPPTAAQETGKEFTIGGDTRRDQTIERCVDVEIGGTRSFKCLNDRLKRRADDVNPALPGPPLDATSPDTKIGVMNAPAVKEQYGSNYGKSIYPYRPPPLIYSSPLR